MFRYITREVLENLYKIETEYMLHSELKGAGFDFSPIVKKTERIISAIKKLDEDSSEDLMSKSTEEKITNIINSLTKNIAEKAYNFSITENSGFQGIYVDIVKTVEREENNYLDYVQPVLDHIELKNLSTTDISDKVSSLEKSRKDFEGMSREMAEKLEEAYGLVATLRQDSGVKASSISANHFSSQAAEHNKMSKWWLGASLVLLLSLLLIVTFLLNAWWPFQTLKLGEAKNAYESVQIVVFKVIILSIAYFALHQSIKNYRVHSHLHIMNKHRDNALSVYPQMLTAGEDTEIRNTITAEAARSIFEPVPSGYLDGDDDPRPVNPTAIVNKIIEKKMS